MTAPLSELTETITDLDTSLEALPELEASDLPVETAEEEEASARPAVARWYAVQVASSCEKKV